MKQLESQLQAACFRWFSYSYRRLRGLLFAVPNGGYRNSREAAIMKGTGVVSGVSDLILLVPNDEYHGLCIELKVGKNKMTLNQADWAEQVISQGYKHLVVRTFEDFKDEVEGYLEGE